MFILLFACCTATYTEFPVKQDTKSLNTTVQADFDKLELESKELSQEAEENLLLDKVLEALKEDGLLDLNFKDHGHIAEDYELNKAINDILKNR